MRKNTTGMSVAIASDARNTPRSVCDAIAGRRTDSGCLAGSLSTSIGHRKSFQLAMVANTDTTPRIGLDIGRTTDQNSRYELAPSTLAASNTSRGRLSKNRATSTTLNALAPDGSHTAKKLLMSDVPSTGGLRIVSYSGTSSTTLGTNNVAITRPLTILPQAGRRTDSTYPPVVATSSCTNHDPAAIQIVLRKYLLIWTSFHASEMFSQRMPCGKIASGDRMMSCVGVTANFASSNIGPMPTTMSSTRRITCSVLIVALTRETRHSCVET